MTDLATSEEIRNLYVELYRDGVEREWRDVGAVDKADNIVRAWRSLGSSERPKVLEIGSGEGAIAQALHDRRFYDTYSGFDLSPSGVDEARARAVPEASFELVLGDQLPVADDSADVAMLSHVVEHLEHPRQLLYEARRIAPLLLVEVPLELNAGAPHDYVLDALGHINKYNSTAIRHLVQSCGYEVLTQFTTNPSVAVATFHSRSLPTRLKWCVKELSLKVWPALARTRFTYHETLLARRLS